MYFLYFTEFDHCYCAKLMDWGYSSFMKWKVIYLSWYAIPPPWVYIHIYSRIRNFCGHEIFAVFTVGLILGKYYPQNNHSYTHMCASHVPSIREDLITSLIHIAMVRP